MKIEKHQPQIDIVVVGKYPRIISLDKDTPPGKQPTGFNYTGLTYIHMVVSTPLTVFFWKVGPPTGAGAIESTLWVEACSAW